MCTTSFAGSHLVWRGLQEEIQEVQFAFLSPPCFASRVPAMPRLQTPCCYPYTGESRQALQGAMPGEERASKCLPRLFSCHRYASSTPAASLPQAKHKCVFPAPYTPTGTLLRLPSPCYASRVPGMPPNFLGCLRIPCNAFRVPSTPPNPWSASGAPPAHGAWDAKTRLLGSRTLRTTQSSQAVCESGMA